MLQIIDVTASARPCVPVKWASYVLLIFSINFAVGCIADMAKAAILGQLDAADVALGAALSSLAGLTAWVGWKNVDVLGSIRRSVNLVVLPLLVIFYLAIAIVGAMQLRTVVGSIVAEHASTETEIKTMITAPSATLLSGALGACGALLGMLGILRARSVRFRGFNANVTSLLTWFEGYFSLRVSRRSAPARRPFLGWVLLAFGLAWLGGFSLIPDEFAYKNGINQLSLMGYMLLVFARQCFTPRIETLLKADRRAPILFLRSFADERHADMVSVRSQFALFDYSLESRLAGHFGRAGAFIAVAAPSKRNFDDMHLGAARARFSDDEWQRAVLSWIERARCVVLLVSATKWAQWELERIIAEGHSSKTIFIVPEFQRLFFIPGRRKRDARIRFQMLVGKLAETPWAAALAQIERPERLRSLLLHQDGDVTAIISRATNRSSHHIAAILAHHVLLTGKRTQLAPTRRRRPSTRGNALLGAS